MRKLFSLILLCSVVSLLLTPYHNNVSQITIVECNNNGIEVANHIFIKLWNTTILYKKYVAKS